MKTILYTLFFAFCSQFCHAQTWLANDHKWNYRILGGIFQVDTYYQQNIGKDTIIAGQPCKEIFFVCDSVNLSKRYAYAEGNKVFAWRSSSENWIKIYDFDLPVGGILAIPSENPFGFPTKYQVTLIDEVTVGTFTAKRQQWLLLDNANTRYDVIEGIGNVGLLDKKTPVCNRFFTHLTPFCGRPLDSYDHIFNCFWSNNGSFAPFSSGTSTFYDLCEVTSAPAVSDPKVQVSVQPNPAHDQLTVRTAMNNPIRRVQLYDIQGVLRLDVPPTEAVSAEINTTNLAAGMYLLLVQTTEGQYAQLVLIQ